MNDDDDRQVHGASQRLYWRNEQGRKICQTAKNYSCHRWCAPNPLGNANCQRKLFWLPRESDSRECVSRWLTDTIHKCVFYILPYFMCYEKILLWLKYSLLLGFILSRANSPSQQHIIYYKNEDSFRCISVCKNVNRLEHAERCLWWWFPNVCEKVLPPLLTT